MTRLLLTILILGGVAGAIPYLLLRKTGGIGRSVLAYALGLLVSSLASLGVLLTTQAVLPAPIIDADRVIGSGLLCAVIGPILGVLAARHFRARDSKAGISVRMGRLP
jgi:hypothetical protein